MLQRNLLDGLPVLVRSLLGNAVRAQDLQRTPCVNHHGVGVIGQRGEDHGMRQLGQLVEQFAEAFSVVNSRRIQLDPDAGQDRRDGPARVVISQHVVGNQ